MRAWWLFLALSAQTESTHGAPIAFAAALEAAAHRPDVKAAEAELQTRRLLDEGLGPLAMDPVLQLQPGYRFGPAQNQGFDGRVGIQQAFNLEDWGGARRDAARAERAALELRLSSVRRAARREAARAWLQTWTLAEELELRRRMKREARALMNQTERRFELGMGSRIEGARARAFVARARLDVLDAEGQLYEAGLALAAACGRADAALIPTGPPPGADVSSELLDRLGVEDDPEVRTAEAEVDAALVREAEATAQDGWQLLTGVGVAHEPTEQIVPSATLGITLPISGRNRRSSSERGAMRAAMEERETATTLAMRRLRLQAVHEVEHTHRVREAHDTQLVPACREELDASTRAFELGGAPLRQVLDARVRLLDAEIASVRARGDHLAAAFDLRILVTLPEEGRS